MSTNLSDKDLQNVSGGATTSYGYPINPDGSVVFKDKSGNYTKPGVNDRIVVQSKEGLQITYFRGSANGEPNATWGHNVTTETKINGRTRYQQQWTTDETDDDGTVHVGVGGLIPAGTGMRKYRNIELDYGVNETLIEAYKQAMLEAEEEEEEEESTSYAEDMDGVAPEMATADDLESATEYAAEDTFVNETDIDVEE